MALGRGAAPALAWLSACGLVLELALGLAGLRLNLSPSMPRGLYWVGEPRVLVAGDLVVVCVPASSRSRPAPLDRCRPGEHAILKGIARIDAAGLWLAGRHPAAWDSRFYGAVDPAAVVRRATPLLVWPREVR